VLNRLNKNTDIIALQDASISLVPILITITFLMLFSEVLALVSSSSIVESFRSIPNYFYAFFPLIFTLSLAASFAKSKNIDSTCFIIVCSGLLIISTADSIETFEQLNNSTYFKLLPIPLCFMTATMFKYFSSKSSLHLLSADDMSLHLKKTFNSILPSVFTFILMFLLILFMESIWEIYVDKNAVGTLGFTDTDSLVAVIFLKFIFKLTWFFGINPSHIFAFLQTPYFEAFNDNKIAFEAGLTIPNINVSGMYFFTNIGGAGSVLCLLIAVLLFSKSRHHIRVAKLSALPCTFNISEIIHYGMPIVFNPFLFVPFVFVPIILHLNTYFFMWAGLVSPVVEYVQWTTPSLLNAYLATGSSFAAILLQLLNLFIGVVIYLKFLRMLEASHIDEKLIINFSNKFDLDTKNIQALQYRNQQSLMRNLDLEQEINAALLKISEGDLLLYYQPIFCSNKKIVTNVEALMRLKDKTGQIHSPTFLNVLSKAGLSSDIDKWVIKRVVKQSHEWSETLINIRISINISPNSLVSRGFVDFLISMNSQSKYPFSIEILENQAVFEEQKINEHLKLLKENGISVLLDDFGSGFSALSMLSTLNIDGVKYDMEFAEQLHLNVGAKLFSSCLNVSKALDHITVLEGVETEEQFELAKKAGVDYIQGFYISKPLSSDDLIGFLKS
jgi:lactose/cellobiose-specific phosphotransferase system IIC component